MYRADRSSKVFFRYTSTQDSINSIVTEKIRQNLQAKQLGVLDGRNMLGYKHGKQWRWGNNRDADQTSAMQSISAEYSVHQDEIVNHNTHIIQDYVSRLSEQLFGAFMKGLYEMVDQSAKEIGTSVNANDYGGDFVKGWGLNLQGPNLFAKNPFYSGPNSVTDSFVSRLQRSGRATAHQINTLKSSLAHLTKLSSTL